MAGAELAILEAAIDRALTAAEKVQVQIDKKPSAWLGTVGTALVVGPAAVGVQWIGQSEPIGRLSTSEFITTEVVGAALLLVSAAMFVYQFWMARRNANRLTDAATEEIERLYAIAGRAMDVSEQRIRDLEERVKTVETGANL